MMYMSKRELSDDPCYIRTWDKLIKEYSHNENPVIIRFPNGEKLNIKDAKSIIEIITKRFYNLAECPQKYKKHIYYNINYTDQEYKDLLFLHVIGMTKTDCVIIGMIYVGELVDMVLRSQKTAVKEVI